MTHIIASNLTPKKRVEFERYKVVRPEWITDCVKAGKALPWSHYRLIEHNSQQSIAFAPQPLAKSATSYRSVSSRDEKVAYGGKGILSQESSSYPTPPEMRFLDLKDIDAFSTVELSTTNKQNFMEADERQEPPGVHCPSVPLLPSSNVPEHSISDQTSHQPLSAPLKPEDVHADEEEVITTRKLHHPSKNETNEQSTEAATAHNAALLANPALRLSTVLNPDFLQSYFGQSRLHHLSTWKADLKTHMQQLAAQKPRRVRKSGPRWILHVDFDCFFCSVSLLSRPELKDKPVCVGHGGARSGEIASCNYPAREFGIHNGMRYPRHSPSVII